MTDKNIAEQVDEQAEHKDGELCSKTLKVSPSLRSIEQEPSWVLKSGRGAISILFALIAFFISMSESITSKV